MRLATPKLLPSLALLLAPALIAQTTPAPTARSPYNDGVARMDKAPVPPSRSLTITVGGHTTTLTLGDLAKLPQTTIQAHNGHTNQDETYAGPLVSDVLASAGLTGKQADTIILHSAVLATGTDGYFVLYSAAEVEPAFSRSQVIVALTKAGQPNIYAGNLQLVNTDGARPARWVHGLAKLNVISMGSQQ